MTLPDLITELRLELAAELPQRLHAGQPSGDTKDGEPNYGHMTGLPFSRAFDRYLSGDHGGDYLASDSFTEIRDWCRIEHYQQKHTGEDPFAWNLCARIAIAAVELRQPIAFVADSEAIDVWLARDLLTKSLGHARDWREGRRSGIVISDESRRQLDESEHLPVVLAREHSVEHERKVWELWRSKFPYVRPWEAELDRRRAYHAVHCHGRCALLLGEAA